MSAIHEEEDALCIRIANDLDDISPLPSTFCLFKVHTVLRNVIEKAYEPNVIAIGPYHHGKENLKMMQGYKLRYLHSFRERENIDMRTFIDVLKPLEPQIRRYYAESIDQNPDKLIEMMLVDGIFFIELLKRFNDPRLRPKDDPIFNLDWMLSSLKRDLLLFENQLPFFVPSKLYDLIEGEKNHMDFLDLVMEFFDQVLPGEGSRGWVWNLEYKYNHLLGLLHSEWVPSFARLGRDGSLENLEEIGNRVSITYFLAVPL